jgi:hypothetical protein
MGPHNAAGHNHSRRHRQMWARLCARWLQKYCTPATSPLNSTAAGSVSESHTPAVAALSSALLLPTPQNAVHGVTHDLLNVHTHIMPCVTPSSYTQEKNPTAVACSTPWVPALHVPAS